jgi:hypothetical protein
MIRSDTFQSKIPPCRPYVEKTIRYVCTNLIVCVIDSRLSDELTLPTALRTVMRAVDRSGDNFILIDRPFLLLFMPRCSLTESYCVAILVRSSEGSLAVRFRRVKASRDSSHNSSATLKNIEQHAAN